METDSSRKIDTNFIKINEIIPPGTVVAYAGSTAPSGRLLWTGSLESAKAVIEEKREKFEQMMGEEYVGWVLGRIEEMLDSV